MYELHVQNLSNCCRHYISRWPVNFPNFCNVIFGGFLSFGLTLRGRSKSGRERERERPQRPLFHRRTVGCYLNQSRLWWRDMEAFYFYSIFLFSFYISLVSYVMTIDINYLNTYIDTWWNFKKEKLSEIHTCISYIKRRLHLMNRRKTEIQKLIWNVQPP